MRQRWPPGRGDESRFGPNRGRVGGEPSERRGELLAAADRPPLLLAQRYPLAHLYPASRPGRPRGGCSPELRTKQPEKSSGGGAFNRATAAPLTTPPPKSAGTEPRSFAGRTAAKPGLPTAQRGPLVLASAPCPGVPLGPRRAPPSPVPRVRLGRISSFAQHRPAGRHRPPPQGWPWLKVLVQRLNG